MKQAVVLAAVLATGCSAFRGAPGDPCPAWTTTTAGVQMAPNVCYAVDSASNVELAMPATPLFGDVAGVQGAGPGTWKVTLPAGHSIVTNGMPSTLGAVWTPRGESISGHGIASSYDGKVIAVAAYGGHIHLSNNGGATWRMVGPNGYWVSVAVSGDGSHLIAAGLYDRVYTSEDGGDSWIGHLSPMNWRSVSMDATGQHLLVTAAPEQLYLSNDGGATWKVKGHFDYWGGGAVAADGRHFAAVLNNNNQIYLSADSGATWTPHAIPTKGAGSALWTVAMDADGGCLVVGEHPGYLYGSGDWGTTWSVISGYGPWNSVATNIGVLEGEKPCTTVLAAGDQGLFLSPDGGTTWYQRSSDTWMGAASSSDGTALAAVPQNGRVYTSTPRTSAGGALLGGENDLVELQYAGNGLWTAIGSVGNPGAQ